MSIPQCVFLDTNVFDGQNYSFDSIAFKTFVDAAQSRGIKLLLPDPTEREVCRHIRERANEAMAALNQARRTAPFLNKWPHFPTRSFPAVVDWDVTQLALGEWKRFLAQLPVEHLGYEGVALKDVMNWYDNIKPPFGQGKKRKEFPDALAVAILDQYVSDHRCVVAMVSDDQDMKLACTPRTSFLHFASLPRLTELLVAGDGKIDVLRKAIFDDLSKLEDAIKDEATGIHYYHVDGRYEINRSSLEGVEISDVRLVALGNGQATLTFEAELETLHDLEWQEEVSDGDFAVESGEYLDSGNVHGTAKVDLDAKSLAIASVAWIQIDEIELKVTESPYRR